MELDELKGSFQPKPLGDYDNPRQKRSKTSATPDSSMMPGAGFNPHAMHCPFHPTAEPKPEEGLALPNMFYIFSKLSANWMPALSGLFHASCKQHLKRKGFIK